MRQSCTATRAAIPFFVTEVLAAGGDTLPATVQDAVLARVARLGPVAQRLVETVAIIPTGVDIGILEAMDERGRGWR